MLLIKKLTFAPIFLIILGLVCFQADKILIDSSIIFSLSLNDALKLVVFALSILLGSVFFVLFSALAQDAKIVLPVSIIGSLFPLVFFSPHFVELTGTEGVSSLPVSVILAVGFFISFVITFLLLHKALNTYINFSPNALLNPSIKRLATFLILILCLGFYFIMNVDVSQNGFSIPDSLIDQAIKFSPTIEEPSVRGVQYTAQLTQDQIDLLKNNPSLLKPYGVDPKILDNISSQPNPTKSQKVVQNTNSPVKDLIRNQVQNLLKPYLLYIPMFLAILLFFALQSVVSLLEIFVPIFISCCFWILEKTNFIRFEKEVREVKKFSL